MTAPDYQLIAEVMLLSEGFSQAAWLAGKVVHLYKLASQQLSQQVSFCCWVFKCRQIVQQFDSCCLKLVANESVVQLDCQQLGCNLAMILHR